MSDLYLIAHLVRGQPAFDIAEEIEPDLWIIPTSGHRAYPYWSIELDLLGIITASGMSIQECYSMSPIPPNHPDHYANLPAAPGRGITDLSFLKPKLPTITRRL